MTETLVVIGGIAFLGLLLAVFMLGWRFGWSEGRRQLRESMDWELADPRPARRVVIADEELTYWFNNRRHRP